MDKVRINWLDSSRGLAFLMVIYHHITLCNEDLMRYFLPIFLTIFFFVSGYLSKDTTSFYKTLEQRTRTLLIPFLLGGLVLILLSQTFSFREQISFKDAILGLILQNGENEILWFIGALYAYSLIFYWIEKLSKRGQSRLFHLSFELVVQSPYPRQCGMGGNTIIGNQCVMNVSNLNFSHF